MKLAFLPESRQDQREAVAWYVRESKELVRRLLDERRTLLKRIKDAPQQFPFVDTNRQMALMTIFPYKLIFQQTPDFTLIIAFAHASQKSGYWHDRDL